MKIRDLPNHARPREKLIEKGPQSLKDNELLAILLRTGYHGKSALDVASRILKNLSLNQLFGLNISNLAKIKGVGKSRASIIIAAYELTQRSNTQNTHCAIKNSQDVANVINFIATKKREHLVALYLNARSELIETQTISIGTLNEGLIHPREVYAPAISNHAAQIIIAHNHPSNNANPSNEDIQITKQIKKAGDILGIELTDHVIITKKSFFSFRDNQLLD